MVDEGGGEVGGRSVGLLSQLVVLGPSDGTPAQVVFQQARQHHNPLGRSTISQHIGWPPRRVDVLKVQLFDTREENVENGLDLSAYLSSEHLIEQHS